jgi:hypothetical protein
MFTPSIVDCACSYAQFAACALKLTFFTSLRPVTGRLTLSQSSYWGIKVSAVVTSTNAVTLSWSSHARSIFSASDQGNFSGFTGQRQIAAVGLCLRRNPNLLFVHRLPAMIPILRIRENLPPVLFDLDDIEHWIAARAALGKASSDRRPIRPLHVPAVILAEYRVARLAQKSLSVLRLINRTFKSLVSVRA